MEHRSLTTDVPHKPHQNRINQHNSNAINDDGIEAIERKDRKGQEIKKGSKQHHITFKDQIPVVQEEEHKAHGLILSTSSYDSFDNGRR